MASSRNTNHKHHHGPWWQHGPCTATWPLVAAQTTDINMASCSTGHRDWDGHWQQQDPWTLTWHQVASWTTDTNMALDSSTGINVACCACPDHRYQHSLDNSMDHGQQSGLWWQHEPWRLFEKAPSRRWTIVHLRYPAVARVRMVTGLGSVFRAYEGSRLLLTTLPVLLGNSMLPGPQQPWSQPLSLLCLYFCFSHGQHTLLFFHFPQLSIAPLFIKVANCGVSHTIYIFMSKQLYMQLSL